MPLEVLLTFAEEHAGLMSVIAAASLVMVIGSAILAPWWLTHLPPEELARLRRGEPRHAKRGPLPVAILKNLAGVILLLAGLAMLLLPGQGLLTILAAALLLRFPGKQRLFGWLLRRSWAQRILRWAERRRERRGA